MSGTRIVIFAKAPVPGKAKTRLIPALGAAGAARLAQDMLLATLREAQATSLSVELCMTPAPWHSEWQPFLPAGAVRRVEQGEGDLGQRLAQAAGRVISEGERILLIGTDCPALDRHRLRSAAEALASHDAVIHPAADGGYALLGLARFDRSLFEDIAWSTPSVFADTMARMETLGWSAHVGDTLHDVDEPKDLSHWPSFSVPPAQDRRGGPAV